MRWKTQEYDGGYPDTGHSVTDVGLSLNFVRFTPKSGHYFHGR